MSLFFGNITTVDQLTVLPGPLWITLIVLVIPDRIISTDVLFVPIKIILIVPVISVHSNWRGVFYNQMHLSLY